MLDPNDTEALAVMDGTLMTSQTIQILHLGKRNVFTQAMTLILKLSTTEWNWWSLGLFPNRIGVAYYENLCSPVLCCYWQPKWWYFYEFSNVVEIYMQDPTRLQLGMTGTTAALGISKQRWRIYSVGSSRRHTPILQLADQRWSWCFEPAGDPHLMCLNG